ncbi:ATP-dependent helicase/nuclease subunit B [Sphingomonas jejuensis]|uniref:ATP-dependent helicase/nuclease subunit B n=1 Tax=Sphingomonas jejuensis TaxID=904715 RepID=A0ABX0XL21_9SPHN|nr:ATP-dependent helicase/nuclease subunit B [Sphingomonas jejuensis]
MPSLFTIDPHRAFADALAAGLIATHRDPMVLARGTILLPSNRAVRAVSDAFVRRAEGGLLMPRLVPLGDPAIDDRIGGTLEPLTGEPSLPPAIAPLERRLRLARLIVAHRPGTDVSEAMRLAADLARTLDQLHVDDVSPQALRALPIPDGLSSHWQRALDQLTLILDRWPAELASIGRMDLTERRNQLFDRLARRWRQQGAGGFVVAAGINLTSPPVARLLRCVAEMDGGSVVFAGLDLEMPEEEWAALGPHDPDPVSDFRPRSIESHPQYHLKLLLDRMSVGRAEVQRWRWGGGRDARAARSRAIASALAPASHTARWIDLPADQRSLAGVTAIVAATPAEEAQAIAIALREALETPGRTAQLVTPDRGLAERVSSHLRRWGIQADDSAGRPLSATPAGTLLLAIVEAAAERFAPVALLALLKHSLVAAGEGRGEWLAGIRRIDLGLRGPRPAPGLAGITAALERAEPGARDGGARMQAASAWHAVRPLLDPLERVAADEPSALIVALRETADRLAGDAAWSRPAGQAAADLIADLEAGSAFGPPLGDPATLARVLRSLMDEVAVRPPQGGHPRIAILGLIEARLQQADLVILGGLNEGTWPALAPADPWLAPRVRAELGLAGLERRIGLSAHSFAEALGAPQVIVTRARRDASGPAVASRFWLRLEAMSSGLKAAEDHLRLARVIDDPGMASPAGRPAPCPLAEERPRRISVTQVDRLKADPFAFYAQQMLRLRALDPLDAEPSAAWRGTAVHAVLEAWAKQDGFDPAALRPRALAMLSGEEAHPLMRALWQPRLMEAIEWIAAQLQKDRERGRVPIVSEATGRVELGGIMLDGRADRIDRDAGGGIVVVDYKTGKAPGPKAVGAGFALQLGLLGLIAEQGGFPGVSGTATGFEYWSLAKGRDGFGEVTSPAHDEGKGGRIITDRFTAVAAANFKDAADRWLTGNEPFTAKLHPEHAPYGDYDQLMRLEEWYGRDAR